MKSNYTHIVALLDRSGSMQPIISDMRGGFESFIEQQKSVEGDLTLTTVQFDDVYEKITDFLKIESDTVLNMRGYLPRGNTALYDSFCRLIDETGNRLAEMNESDRPEKVLFICITDGFENASNEFSQKDLKQRIEEQKNKYNWEFVFLGANQDSFLTSRGFGLNKKVTRNFIPTKQGIHELYQAVSTSTASYRAGGASAGFSFEDDAAVQKK